MTRAIDLALIDGEHTNIACFSDFISVLPLMAEDAVIAYHDANLIPDAILNAERVLGYLGIPFHTVFLPDCVAAIGLRGMAGPLASAVADVALDREKFLALSRQTLRAVIAQDGLLRGDLGQLELSKQLVREGLRRASLLTMFRHARRAMRRGTGRNSGFEPSGSGGTGRNEPGGLHPAPKRLGQVGDGPQEHDPGRGAERNGKAS